MIDLLVVGIGSPFQDDQIAWEVVNRLEKKMTLQKFSSKQLQFRCTDRPGLGLLELIRDAKMVFLIDAIKTNTHAPIGTLHCFQHEELEGVTSVYSSHAFGVAEAMKLGKVLDCLPEKVVLYGVEMGDVGSGFALSGEISVVIDSVVLRIEEDILLGNVPEVFLNII